MVRGFSLRAILAGFTLASLLLASSNSEVLAKDYNCTGTLGSITVDNLNVPKNATCILNGTQVEGNLFVRNKATLYAYAVKVDGNIQADRSARVEVHPDSLVGGDIQVNSSGSLLVSGVQIDGNLQAFQNTGGVSIIGNTIDNNLECLDNDPPPTGGDNNVGGDMEGQCANLQSVDPPPVVIDREAPVVRWIGPVHVGERHNLHEGESVRLEVEASDNDTIAQVTFLRWDAVNELYVTLGILDKPPFQIEIDASTLNPNWNQVFVFASDPAGNKSDNTFIWIYKLVQGEMDNFINLPMIGK
jgi:hypothetical protein